MNHYHKHLLVKRRSVHNPHKKYPVCTKTGTIMQKEGALSATGTYYFVVRVCVLICVQTRCTSRQTYSDMERRIWQEHLCGMKHSCNILFHKTHTCCTGFQSYCKDNHSRLEGREDNKLFFPNLAVLVNEQ